MADARGEYWYLGDGVEPTKITVPELRSILLKHGVHYPASAKKPALVELFTVNVLPQAAKIQRQAERTVRSSKGIVDVPSSSASTTTTDDTGDDTLVPPPSVTRPTPRRKTRAWTAEEEDEEPVPARTPARRPKTPSRTVPNKHARESDADADGQPAHQRTRKSLAPKAKEPTPDPDAWHRPAADSPFTQENPFQSRSSPPNTESHARDRRRKTMGFEQKERRKSDANRRRTHQPPSSQQDDGVVVPSRKTFEMPVARARKEEVAVVAMPDSDDEGEEYTPEEQLELVRERAKNGEVDILPRRRRRDPSKTASTVQAFLLTFFATAFAVLGGVWREEKFAIGFCNTGSVVPTAIAGVEIPEFATPLLPQCEPCPPHAYCYPNLQVECEKDFIKQPHPLSFGGFLPLPPTCEPDTEKTRKVTQVADHAVQMLRQRRAQYECGDEDAKGNVVQSPDVSVSDLKEGLLARKGKTLSNSEFEDLFAKAIGEIPGRQEVVEQSDG
jgi:hypothetical protein